MARNTDHVKLGAEKVRMFGEKLANQVEAITAEAGDQAQELQHEWRRTEKRLREAKKRLTKPTSEIANVALDLVHDVRKRITAVLR